MPYQTPLPLTGVWPAAIDELLSDPRAHEI
jgi:hypothetical protein